jgi:hypothetical protein
MAAASGTIRFAGIVLLGNGWPVSGSRTVVVKMPCRWAAVGTFVMRVTPRVILVPS